MTTRTVPPFRADHVGSLLRPPELTSAREEHSAGRIGAAELRAAEDEAIRDAVALQQRVGLQSVTDGEFRRGSWHMDFIYQLGGVERAKGAFTSHFRNDARSGGFAPLRYVPAEKLVVLGLVTSKRGELEHKDELKRRIDEASRYIAVEQLCLSSQCGFSSTVEGNALTLEQEIAKLELVVETAAEVWG